MTRLCVFDCLWCVKQEQCDLRGCSNCLRALPVCNRLGFQGTVKDYDDFRNWFHSAYPGRECMLKHQEGMDQFKEDCSFYLCPGCLFGIETGTDLIRRAFIQEDISAFEFMAMMSETGIDNVDTISFRTRPKATKRSSTQDQATSLPVLDLNGSYIISEDDTSDEETVSVPDVGPRRSKRQRRPPARYRC